FDTDRAQLGLEPARQRIVGGGREERHADRPRRRARHVERRHARATEDEQSDGDGGAGAAATADHGPTVRLARAACGPPGKSCRYVAAAWRACASSPALIRDSMSRPAAS